MKENRFLIFIIFSLLAINVYTIIRFYRFKKQNITASPVVSEHDELHSYTINFATNLRNSNFRLEEVRAKDSSGTVFSLKDLINNNQEQILVCRFSELHCESCVNFSIQLFRHWVDSIGKNNVLLLGSYRNNKIFNRTKPLYSIHNLNVYNIQPLNIPAEELGYPYYFVLHSDLTISDAFVPDKATPIIANNYLKLINERYFAIKKNE
jgi:hypothetical protein